MRYKLAIFDLDGTIINSRPFHAAVFEDFFRENWQEVPYQVCYNAVGATVRTLFEDVGVPRELHDGFFEKLDAYYQRGAAKFLPGTTLAEGILPVLDAMRSAGMKTAIVTNSLTPVLDMFLDHHGIRDRFDEVVGADKDSRAKNERCQMVEERFGASGADVLYVGDAESDFVLANEMGYDACFAKTEIAWYRDADYIARELAPKYTVDSYAELLEMMRGW